MASTTRGFALKKIHSLLGVIPLGLFLVEHFIANASFLFGESKFEAVVQFLESIPYVWVLEWGLIFIPLIIHGVLGVYMALQARYNTTSYPYFRNIAFDIQRISGLYLFGFLIYHIYSVKIVHLMTGVSFVDIIQGQLANPILLVLYFLFVVSASFHIANGLFGFAINWGIARGERFQKVWQAITVLIFFAFTGAWALIMLGFMDIIKL